MRFGILLEFVVQVINQSTNVEPAGGVANEGDRIVVQILSARDAFHEVITKSGRAGDDRGRRKVVEVMQDHGLSVCAVWPLLLPATELWSDSSVIFHLAECVESGEARNQNDMHARIHRVTVAFASSFHCSSLFSGVALIGRLAANSR